MNPFNAWPDRLWIGKLSDCDVCHAERIRAAMIIGSVDYTVARVLCHDCVHQALMALRTSSLGIDRTPLV